MLGISLLGQAATSKASFNSSKCTTTAKNSLARKDHGVPGPQNQKPTDFIQFIYRPTDSGGLQAAMAGPCELNLATPAVKEVQSGQKCTVFCAHKVTL